MLRLYGPLDLQYLLNWASRLPKQETFKRRGFDRCVGRIPWRRAWQPISVLLRISWTEEPGELQPKGLQRAEHD